MSLFFEENRLQKILKRVDNSKLDIKSLCTEFNISEKTIRNDIKFLMDYFQDCLVINSDNYFIYSHIYDNIEFTKKKCDLYIDDLYNSPKRRYLYIIMRLLRTHDYVIIDDLAEELNISRTTLNVDIRNLNNLIKDYRIEIIGKTNRGKKVEGSEINIRYFIFDALYDHMYKEFNFPNEFIDDVYRLIKEHSLQEYFLNDFFKILKISVMRAMNGYRIKKNLVEHRNDFENTTAFSFCSNVSRLIIEYFNIELNYEEQKYLSVFIIGIKNSIDLDHSKEISIQPETLDIIKGILVKFNQYTNINIENSSTFNDFIYHIHFMLNRIKYGYIMKNPIFSGIKREYKFSFRMAEILRDIISEKFKIYVSDDEMSYFALYFELFIKEEEEKNSHKNKFNDILLICDKNINIGKILIYKLKKVIQQDLNVDLFSNLEQMYNQNKKFEDYDLIIVTSENIKAIEQKTIYINEFISETDLSQKLNVFVKNTDKNFLGLRNATILDHIEKNIFYMLEETSDIQAIKFMLEDMEQEEIISEAFYNEILNQVTSKKILSFENILIPHALNNKNGELKIAVGLVKNNDLYDRFIFIILIPDSLKSNDLLLVNLYEEIMFLSKNTILIKEIEKINNYYEFLSILLKDKL